MNIKRKPKQNFNINLIGIYGSDLNGTQKSILITTLTLHKEHCKFEYKNILNSDLCEAIGVTEPTLIKHREALEKQGYFTLKKIRTGKSFVLQYRFNWTKLLKLNFIEPIEKNEFKPKFESKKKMKPVFQKDDNITFENSNKLDDDKLYSIRIRERNWNGEKQFGSWKEDERWNGNMIKAHLRNEDIRRKRESDEQYNIEIKYLGEIK